jgi:hypothetical protein
MTMPQLAAVQEEVVALGGGGGDDIDVPPPHALKVAINKVHAAAGNHRR